MDQVIVLRITRQSFMSLGLQDKLEFAKRGAVGGGAQVQAETKPPSPKTDADLALIKKALQSNANLNTIANLDESRIKAMCDVMWKEEVAEGTALIKQNDLQEILLRANEAEMKQNLNYVGRCEVFENALKESEKKDAWTLTGAELAAAMMEMTFNKDETIFEQGVAGLLRSCAWIDGHLHVVVGGHLEPGEVASLQATKEKAPYFGEKALRALENKEPRAATVKVTSAAAKTLFVDKESFEAGSLTREGDASPGIGVHPAVDGGWLCKAFRLVNDSS
eukprot:Skav206740  [mRNA]  locus=scaffold1022:957:15453:+ [translate_table: standard]